MSSSWLLTLARDCDVEALARHLSELGVELDTARRPLPLGDEKMAVTVRTNGITLPGAVSAAEGVLAVHPASRMKRF